MIEFLLKGGVLMYPIFLCSVIATAITLERLIYLTIAGVRNKKFLSQAIKVEGNNRLEELNELSQKIKSPISNFLSSAIENLNKPDEERNVIIQRVGSNQMRDLEKNLGLLGIIAHISPLLGLLGTVFGMIKAFMTIQNLGGQVDAVALAGGIWEAMITTAAGLSVAIPTLIFYHFLEGRIDNIVADMKDTALYFPEVFAKYQLKPSAGTKTEEENQGI